MDITIEQGEWGQSMKNVFHLYVPLDTKIESNAIRLLKSNYTKIKHH